jgi:hypothetical protein
MFSTAKSGCIDPAIPVLIYNKIGMNRTLFIRFKLSGSIILQDFFAYKIE